MDEQEYYEKLQKQRKARREAARRKHERNRRIFFGSIFLVILLIIIIIFKACSSGSKKETTSESPSQSSAVVTEQSTSPSLAVTTPEITTVSANLAFVGDIMCYDNQITAATVSSGYDFSSCFTNVSGYISAADLAVANLELNFCGGPSYTGKPTFNAPEALASNLASAGFDIMQTANTYSIVNGLTGLESTLSYVHAAGMDAIGTYSSEEDADENGVLIKEVNGIKIAFIAFTKGVNNYTVPEGSEYCVDLLYTDYYSDYSEVDTDAITAKIEAAKEQEPDVIIALLHWGSEYEVCDSASRSSSQATIEDLMFENGVDAIIGSHPHVVGGMERKTVTTAEGEEKKVFVAYSLGNFMSSMTTDNTQASVILNLEITKDSTGAVSLGEISYVPVYIQIDEASGEVVMMDIHASLADESVDDETAAALESALDTIHTNAGEELDVANVSESDTATSTPDSAAQTTDGTTADTAETGTTDGATSESDTTETGVTEDGTGEDAEQSSESSVSSDENAV